MYMFFFFLCIVDFEMGFSLCTLAEWSKCTKFVSVRDGMRGRSI
jgi:hypothetical protein